MTIQSRRHMHHRRLQEWPVLSAEAFDTMVKDTLDNLPAWAQPYLDHVAVIVEPEPPTDEEPSLLGLYVGGTIFDSSPEAQPPDVILVFQGPHIRLCRSGSELRREVGDTVLHEIAHHFGLEENLLEEIGPLG